MLRFTDLQEPTIADRCIRPLCFAAPGDEHYGLDMIDLTLQDGAVERRLQFGLQGSAVLFQYRGRHFAVFTRHQIAQIPGEAQKAFMDRMDYLLVLMDDGTDSTSIPFNTYLFSPEANDDESDYVIGVVEYEMLPAYSREQFFPVDRHRTGRSGDLALASGLPSHLQRMVMEPGGMRILPICKSGTVESRNTCGVVRYPEDGFPLDGMSGGAVFVTRLASDGHSFEIFLEGVIQRGGGGYVRYLGLETILNRIDGHLAEQNSRFR
ncbi:hypothetical protein GFM11_35170 [Rhizobium leguminosarum bv. viciae]|uniref:hypothetical protein n=1 Tax=Rhizobium leguminosarum TaxID=384 RepID=UPI001441B294|nr:hypothetical protein [Rhizobium leguminosarum]NKK18395.1 hypothetical protein [Rhizobium leguminosarum bv. viciae]